jgi:C4-dicarboxylate transporter, DctQ subunit
MLRHLKNLEGYILSLTFVSLALIATVQVLCRYVFNYSFTWFEEGGRYIGIFATFLGASLAVKKGTHFSTEVLSGFLSPKARRVQRAFIGLICGSFLSILAFYGFRLVLKQYGFGTTTPTIEMPMYIAYLPIPVFCSIMALRFFKSIVDAIRGDEPLSGSSEDANIAGKASML